MTRYVNGAGEVREFLGRFDLAEERREQLMTCKCWFFVSETWAHVVFRTKNRPDDAYEHFSFWHLGQMAPREFWTS